MSQNIQAKVFILVGKVSTGKTTYALEKQESESAICLSIDEMQLIVFGPDLTSEELEQTFDGCRDYQKNLALRLLKKNIDVYLDGGFWTEYSRSSIKQFFEVHGVEVEQIFFDISLKERLRRNKKRNSGNDSHSFKIKDKDLALFDSLFEEPTIDNNTTIIRENMHMPV